jgi:hypothetical protein
MGNESATCGLAVKGTPSPEKVNTGSLGGRSQRVVEGGQWQVAPQSEREVRSVICR